MPDPLYIGYQLLVALGSFTAKLRIMDKETVMFDKFPFSPLEMKARKNWATSTSFEIDVIAVSDSKAHLVLRNCDRLRPDGSLIENATAFYAFTKTPDGWKIFAMSAIEFPA